MEVGGILVKGQGTITSVVEADDRYKRLADEYIERFCLPEITGEVEVF